MKKFLSLLFLGIFFFNFSFAQDVGERVKDRAVNDANAKVDEKVDNTINKIDEKISGLFKKKNKKQTTTTVKTDSISKTSSDTTSPAITAGASFSDFIPGQTVIFQDNFIQDAIADFPAKWNSTGSGKVSTLNGNNSRWLEIADNTLVTPYMEAALPENCTIEFDLFLNAPEGSTVPFIQFGLSDSKNILTQDVYRSQHCWVSLDNYNDDRMYLVNYGLNGLDPLGNKQSFPLTNYANKILHVSIAINKTRLRVYLDQTKIVDLPRILTTGMLNAFYIANYPKIPASNAGLFIGNMRIASASTDARSLLVKQFMEEGKAVTNDILFDVNSDVIQPSSYSIINQIGDAMKSNGNIGLKIIGYTDSDGSTDDNISLSKRRAESVKNYLKKNYAIADFRIQTDGKGESEPVASNDSEAGKAKNRRVEFIKL